ncbi:DedA family protein [Mangrovicoccus sp. HB161399]|uniref:DedA family protein n=1 Tax=Mangrovicoccus sp. HB161399 TaxID=2720392 RepID=UPI0015551461|nr:DedA family protein [Mangrovicoccus sp. HB161399]
MFDVIAGIMGALGYAGTAVLMFLENLFPPIPSELVMPLAGFEAAPSARRLAAMILAGTAGSLAGAAFWYWVGRKLGAQRLKALAARHGRWLTIAPGDVDRASDWFARHGRAAVLIARLVPGVRTFISVPAGLARMPFGEFLAWSAIGTLAWTGLLAAAGWWLQSGYSRVQAWLDPVSTAVVAAIAGLYLYRVATFGRRLRRREG